MCCYLLVLGISRGYSASLMTKQLSLLYVEVATKDLYS